MKLIEKLKENKKIAILAGSVILLILILVLVFCIKGCKAEVVQDVEPTTAPTPTVTPTPTPEPTATPIPTPTPNLHIGEARSDLSGEWVKEEITKDRPYAVMFNNIAVANPQSGIGEAKILYEAVVEAGITRLMGIFEGLDENSTCADRIGSVRSARHYYASFADEYDAIFVHFGETVYATRKIEELNLDHLEGIYGIGSTVYYRDTAIKAPHNAFATVKGIKAGAEKLGFRTTHNEDFKPHYNFYEEDTKLEGGKKATYIDLPYSTYMNPHLEYNKKTGLYTRYQFGDVHIDYNTNEPLTFKNVIIQVVKEWNKDKNGYQTMDIEDSEGHGYYITNGSMKKITWKKNEATKFMRYYDEAGEELTINPGKTFISIFPDYNEDKISFTKAK